MSDQLIVNVGSVDWTGGTAPAGGVHTGISTITMVDGKTFRVAHSIAEVSQKLDAHSRAMTSPAWVAFDVPGSAMPVVLDSQQIISVK